VTPAPPPAATPIRRVADGAVLVGRSEARGALDAAARATQNGRASIVLVVAEAGFGKTTLITDLTARRSPGHIMRATAEQDETSVSYGVLGQLLHGWAGSLAPRLAGIVRGEHQHTDPFAVGVDLLSLIDGPSTGPVTLIVDDVHWADRPSLRALAFALRRAPDAPILTVLTCRSAHRHSLPHSLDRLLAERAITIRLPPFGPADVADLAHTLGHASMPPRLAERIAEHAAGSPLHARAILDELDPTLRLPPGRPLPIPASYARLVEDHLDACPPDGAALARATAIMSTPRPLPLISAVANIADPLPALDAAVRAGLLARPAADGAIRLVHPLARAAVYQSIQAVDRAELHRRAAAQVTPIDEAAALRHRIAAAAGTDPGLAEQIAERGRADRRRADYESATAWLRAAVRLTEPTSTEADRYLLELVETVVTAADVADEPELRAQIDARPVSPLREYLLARLDTLAGRLPAARDRALTAWQMASGRVRRDDPVTGHPGTVGPSTRNVHRSESDLLARIAAELARTHLTIGHGAAAADWARRALTLAPQGSDAGQDSPGTLLLAIALQGRPDEALAALAGLPSVIENPTTDDLDPMIARGLLSLWAGNVEQAIADLTPVVRLTRHGPAHLNLGASAYLAEAQYRAGDWDTAISEAETGIALALDLDHVRTVPLLHAAAAAPRADRGEFEAATAHVERALASSEQVGDMQTMLWARTAAARLGRARGDAEAVLTAAEHLARSTDLDAVNEPSIAAWQCHYAWALAELGRLDDAAAVLDGVARVAIERRLPAARLAVAAGRADLALRSGNADIARQLIADAASEHDATAAWHPFERARFDLMHGIVARRAGQRREAAEALRRAMAVFAGLRAKPWSKQAESELDRCGVTRRSRRSARPSSPPDELTATEAVVTRLVAAGLSNREIAAHLVVSVKTVEYHVSHALAKAEVTSRTQLATWHLNRSGGAGG